MNEAVSPGALSTLFTDARTHNGWRETPVSDETLREIYALMKWGPTSANCCLLYTSPSPRDTR